MSGLFISLEGPDGSGKTTQIQLLQEFLIERGYEVVLTREPGGTDISEQVRKIILDVNNEKMSNMTELLLYTAARAQLVDEIIRPALEAGKVVICDRFYDSSAVYQGIAREMGVDMVYQLNEEALQGILPDITFLMDMDAEEGIQRKKKQATLDRLEKENLEFHQKVVEGYRSLAKRNSQRIKVLNATDSIDQIQKQMRQYLLRQIEK